MDELQEKLRSELIHIIDNEHVSMLQMAKDIGISYQSFRRYVLEQNSNPTASTLRKVESYLTLH